ncbi:hypothetical protein LCGC14_2451380 [marine sediment metagenome]|uniref:Uncharacterized protein n=1 Tax=marine sediment metagenome TaxID=412755 RepID=A0A0F9DT52_9ZZZZ
MANFEQYRHHGELVWVNSELKGKHRDHCLCFSCGRFKPGVPETNCPKANLNYAVCIVGGLTLPVYECPNFYKEIANMPKVGLLHPE